MYVCHGFAVGQRAFHNFPFMKFSQNRNYNGNWVTYIVGIKSIYWKLLLALVLKFGSKIIFPKKKKHKIHNFLWILCVCMCGVHSWKFSSIIVWCFAVKYIRFFFQEYNIKTQTTKSDYFLWRMLHTESQRYFESIWIEVVDKLFCVHHTP